MISSTASEASSSLETPQHLRSRRHIVWIVLLWAIIYIPGLFRPALLDDADSVHAEAAREMMARHDWSTLYIDGVRYLEKAPLLYWGMATSYKVFGVRDWAARIPLILGVLALLLVTHSLGRRTLGERAGFWAAIVLTTSIGPYLFTRFLIPDMLVALWLAWGMDFFLRTLTEETPSIASCWGLAATVALNVLTKGLIGIVFPAAIIGIYLILTGNLKHLLRMRLISSTVVLLVIAAPWHIVAGLKNPAAGESRGFFWFYFVNEHFLRYIGKRIPHDYDTVPLLVYWALILVWLFPWSAFVLQSLEDVPHRWSAVAQRDERPPARPAAVWHLGRRHPAVLHLLDPSGVLRDACAARAGADDRWMARTGRRLGAGFAATALGKNWIGSAAGDWRAGCFVAAMFLLLQSKSVAADSDLADLLKKNPNEYALSFGHIFDLTPRALGCFAIPLATFAIALVVGSASEPGSTAAATSRRSRNWVLTFMMVFVLFAVHQGLVMFSPILSSKKLADAVQQEFRPGDVIVSYGTYEDASTLNFYVRQPIHVVNTRTEGNLYGGSLFPDAPAIFDDDASLQALWKGPHRVFLWVPEGGEPDYIRQSGSYLLARSGGKLILMNHVVPVKPE